MSGRLRWVDKVHGTLLQRLRYLGGAPFRVVHPPSNIATHRYILLRLSLQCFRLPLQCSAFRCNAFCPPLQRSSSCRRCTIHGTWYVRQKYYTLAQSTRYRLLFQCFSSRCNTLVPFAAQCNSFPLQCPPKSPITRCNVLSPSMQHNSVFCMA